MHVQFSRRVLLRGLAVSGAFACGLAQAQERKLIRIIVPFPAGGISDVMIRLVGQGVAKQLNRTVLIENRPGAAGVIGYKAAQQPAPDATTLVVTYIGFYGLPLTQKGATYDPQKDFVPVCQIADGPGAIFINAAVPATNLAEFIAWARAQPKGVESATSGPGGGSHTWTTWLAKVAGIPLLPVPYKGGSEMSVALITGEAKVMISNTSEALNAQIKAGKVRVIAVTSLQPSALMPGVPTAIQTVPGFVVEGWQGLHAPAGTPVSEINAISAAAKTALEDPLVRERLLAMFLEPRYADPQAFRVIGNRTAEFWKRVTTDLNMQPQ